MARHRKLEPIRIEDLEEAARNSGLETALRFEIPKIKGFPAPVVSLGAEESITTPVVITPDAMTPVNPTPVESHNQEELDITAAAIKTPVINTPVVMTRDTTTPVVMYDGATALISGRPYLVHRCQIAQDGHSRSEQILYDILWRAGEPAAADFRLVRIPMKDLARAPALQMTEKNLRIALQRLVEKLSIEEQHAFDPRQKTARTWKVYSYKAILDRRRAAGLEWTVRDRGVRFIDPKTTPIKTTPVVMQQPDITTPVITAETTPDGMTETTGDITTPPSLLGSSSRTEREGTSSSAVVSNAVINELGMIDDDAIRLLILRCRQKAPDATDEEIADIAAFQARRIRRLRNIDNPIGLLIQQAPKCFEGEFFARYRREREEQERRMKELYDQA